MGLNFIFEEYCNNTYGKHRIKLGILERIILVLLLCIIALPIVPILLVLSNNSNYDLCLKCISVITIILMIALVIAIYKYSKKSNNENTKSLRKQNFQKRQLELRKFFTSHNIDYKNEQKINILLSYFKDKRSKWTVSNIDYGFSKTFIIPITLGLIPAIVSASFVENPNVSRISFALIVIFVIDIIFGIPLLVGLYPYFRFAKRYDRFINDIQEVFIYSNCDFKS